MVCVSISVDDLNLSELIVLEKLTIHYFIIFGFILTMSVVFGKKFNVYDNVRAKFRS